MASFQHPLWFSVSPQLSSVQWQAIILA
jgi:hypothetical protein